MLCSAGHRYSVYGRSQWQPEAIDSGALNVNWNTNRKASQPPTRGPYIARRYRTGPPACGIAAPSSAQTRPSHTTQQGPEDPPEHRLRPVHGRDDERDGDERPDADHVDHVQRRGLPQADAADEGSVGRDRRKTQWKCGNGRKASRQLDVPRRELATRLRRERPSRASTNGSARRSGTGENFVSR